MISPAAKEVAGSGLASAGWLIGAVGGVGTLFEEIAAVVLLIGGIATAFYGSRQKVNLATARTAASTWQLLAEAREAQITEILADKESLRHQVERLVDQAKNDRDRIIALEARPVLDDIARQNEEHHQANLRQFERLAETLAGTNALLADLAKLVAGKPKAAPRRPASGG